MKKIFAFVLVVVLCLSLCSCGSKALSGTYVSESGTYTVVFNEDGTAVWSQDGTDFNGTYQKADGNWVLHVTGSGEYPDTDFIVKADGKNLVISGGAVMAEVFVKQ